MTRIASPFRRAGRASLLVMAAAFGPMLAAQTPSAPVPAPLPGGRPAGRCTIWFVGSSTIERWDTLARDFAPFDARNRGIGGAEFPRLIAGLEAEPVGNRPAMIVLYGGENDIAAGADAATTFARLRSFLSLKQQRLGDVPVIAVSLKPGPARWDDRPRQIAYDAAVAKLAGERRDLRYVDIRPAMLVDGKPGPFTVADGIHMNPAGYAIWTRALRPAIDRALPGRVEECARAAGTWPMKPRPRAERDAARGTAP